jgi:hypothetical protein
MSMNIHECVSMAFNAFATAAQKKKRSQRFPQHHAAMIQVSTRHVKYFPRQPIRPNAGERRRGQRCVAQDVIEKAGMRTRLGIQRPFQRRYADATTQDCYAALFPFSSDVLPTLALIFD